MMSDALAKTAKFFVYGNRHDRLRATWRILVPVLTGFLVLNFAGAVANTLDVNRGKMMLASFGGATLVSIGLLAISARYLDKRPLTEYGYHLSSDWGLDLLAGLGLGALLVMLTFTIALATDSIQIANTLAFDRPAVLWLVVFFLGFVGVTFYEEFLFRGLFITNTFEGLTERGYSPSVATAFALLASSTGFAAIHLPSALAQGANLSLVAAKSGLLGGLLGIAYLLTDDLAFPMGLHLGINYTLMNVFGIGAAGYAGIPSLLTVKLTASGLWSATHGLPILVATLVSYLPVIGWVYWQRDALLFRQNPKRTPVKLNQ